MNEPPGASSFAFNQLINPVIIHDLYEDDYQYIEEMFNTALTYIDGDIGALESAYAAGDLEGLRKATHKIKPTFGFLGMTDVEQECKQFEDKCKTSQSTANLSGEMNELMLTIKKAHKAIEEDYQKLIIHNKP